MGLLKIHTFPDPILKQKSAPVASFDEKMQKLFDDMIETMYTEGGVGLAAPQIGLSLQVLVLCPTLKRGEEHVIVNPVIEAVSGRENSIEGCLSLPGISGEVPRATKLQLTFQDRFGKKQTKEIKKFFARVVQHEKDHLDGILLIDRLDFNRRQEALAKYNRL